MTQNRASNPDSLSPTPQALGEAATWLSPSEQTSPALVKFLVKAAYLLMAAYLAYAWLFSFTPYAEVPWGGLQADYLLGGVLVILLGATLWAGKRGLWPRLLSVGEKMSPRLLFAVALGLRLAWVVFSGVSQTSDWALWDKVAQDMFVYDYWLHPIRRTGPSIQAGLIYHWFGYNTLLALLPNALFSAAQVWFLHRIVALRGHKGAAGLAGLALAVWPAHILYCNLIGGEVQFAFFVILSVYLFIHRHGFWGWLTMCLAAGLALGAAQWLRPTAGVFMGALLGYLVLAGWRRPARLAAQIAALLVGFAIVVGPIVSFNLTELGIFSISPVRLGGWSFLTGTNPESKGFYSSRDRKELAREIARRGGAPEGVNPSLFRERVATELAWKRIRETPGPYLEMALLHKPISLWGWSDHLKWSLRTSVLAPIEKQINWLTSLHYKYFLGLAVLGLLAGWRYWRLDACFYYVAAGVLTTWAHAFFEVQPRYHFMFLPMLALGAAVLPLFSGQGGAKNNRQG